MNSQGNVPGAQDMLRDLVFQGSQEVDVNTNTPNGSSVNNMRLGRHGSHIQPARGSSTEVSLGEDSVPDKSKDLEPEKSLTKDQIDDAIQKRKCNWRKYGQKNLRGKRFQGMDKIRCYYKCNYPGCPVRKQVEKHTLAAEDDKSADTKVRVTGEHNHPPLDPIGDNLDDWQEGSDEDLKSAPSNSRRALLGNDTKPAGKEEAGAQQPVMEEIPEVDESFVAELNERNLNFVIVDPRQVDSPIIFSSPGFCELTGYSSEEVRGRNCRFLQGKDTNRNAIQQIARAIQEVQPIGIILLNYKKNGAPFWNLLSLTPTLDQEGNLLSFIGVQMDVSASLSDKTKQFKIKQAREAREEADKGTRLKDGRGNSSAGSAAGASAGAGGSAAGRSAGSAGGSADGGWGSAMADGTAGSSGPGGSAAGNGSSGVGSPFTSSDPSTEKGCENDTA